MTILSKLITLSKASELLSVSKWYIRRLSEDILPVYKTQGGHRRYKEYDVKSLIGELTEESNTDCVAIYSRVSSNDQKQKGDLIRQKERLYDYCTKNNYTVIESYEEVGSGMNDNRQKLLSILSDPLVTKIVVEHKDRLTRFGFKYIKTLLEDKNVVIEIVNEAKEDKEDLMQDLISVITSMCAKYYGMRRGKRKTEKIIMELSNDKKV